MVNYGALPAEDAREVERLVGLYRSVDKAEHASITRLIAKRLAGTTSTAIKFYVETAWPLQEENKIELARRRQLLVDLLERSGEATSDEIRDQLVQAAEGFTSAGDPASAALCWERANRIASSSSTRLGLNDVRRNIARTNSGWLSPQHLFHQFRNMTCRYGEVRGAPRLLMTTALIYGLFAVIYLPSSWLHLGLGTLQFEGTYSPGTSWTDAMLISLFSLVGPLNTKVDCGNSATTIVTATETVLGYILVLLLGAILERELLQN